MVLPAPPVAQEARETAGVGVGEELPRVTGPVRRDLPQDVVVPVHDMVVVRPLRLVVDRVVAGQPDRVHRAQVEHEQPPVALSAHDSLERDLRAVGGQRRRGDSPRVR
jgi:hypothetical protein